MKKVLVLLCTIMSVNMLAGCGAKSGHSFLEKMTHQQAASYLIKGKTTREQVRSYFGDPEDIDYFPGGNEIWVYKFKRSVEKGSNYIPIIGAFTAGTNDTTKKLKIIFDKNGRVATYSMSQAKGETKVGLV